MPQIERRGGPPQGLLYIIGLVLFVPAYEWLKGELAAPVVLGIFGCYLLIVRFLAQRWGR